MRARSPVLVSIALLALVGLPHGAAGQPSVQAAAPSVTPENVPGVTNFTRVASGPDSTVGCGGATTPSALSELAKIGFRTVISLREASEPGVDLAASQSAAEAAGLRYLNIPFRTASPQPSAVTAFLEAVTDPANQPVYVHCASANRVGAVWYIKRVMIDKWPEDQAMREAEAIGLTHQSLKDFAVQYAKAGGK